MNKGRIFITIALISFIISFIVILQLPSTVPIHWNSMGMADGYGSKWTLLFLAIMPLAIYFGMGFTRKIDPKKAKIDKRPEVYEFFRIFVGSIFIPMNAVILYATINKQFNLSMVLPFITGVMLIIMGNYMPRVPQNYFLGFKVPWALDNEKVWIRTQRMGGIAMVFSGVVTIISALFRSEIAYIIMTACILLSILAATVDSYLYFKKVTKEANKD